MISNPAVLAEVRESWNGVETLQIRVQALGGGGVSLMGGPFVVQLMDLAHNLPFLHACSVLNDALKQLAKEKKFGYQGNMLGKLVRSSESILPWKNYTQICDVVVERRNGLAHRGEVLPRAECWDHIRSIRDELTAWRVIES